MPTTATAAHPITCGNCKTQHPTVADVRSCYANRNAAAVAAGAVPVLVTPATEKQIAFLGRLLDERTTGSAYDRTFVRDTVVAQGRKAVSAAIDNLLAKPVLAKPVDVTRRPAATQPVAAGRYAITGADGTTKFYQVQRPTIGRWAGYTFVKVQASDVTYPVRGDAATGVLAQIASDPKAAMLRYGREIGSCGHCGRTLTNPDSIVRGIGPVCASHMGW